MIYTFAREGVERLVEWTQRHENIMTLYGEPVEVGKHLLLVGDVGVYLCTHCEGNLLAVPEDDLGTATLFVVYARECDPRTDPTYWWQVKCDGFGPDDGCDALCLSDVENALHRNQAGDLTLDVTPTHIRFVARRDQAGGC